MCNTESYQYVCMALSTGLCRPVHCFALHVFCPVLPPDLGQKMRLLFAQRVNSINCRKKQFVILWGEQCSLI